MPASQDPQTSTTHQVVIGVDVGGTFTDLVAYDGTSFTVIKVPSTPPDYQRAVIEAVTRAAGGRLARVVHGSTVATNALLQRQGEPIALITTEGFRDILLIGRQNRPQLYALHVERTVPLVSNEHCFTVRERVDAAGNIVDELDSAEIDRVLAEIQSRGLKHIAVCLLYSFVNPAHEQRIAERCVEAGLTVSLSSDLLPEFREYERASTVAVNATLRPTVEAYLASLAASLPANARDLRIMQSGGGTLTVPEAQSAAAKLVLSGPAGGVLGAAYVAKAAGFDNVITYDMGGTSTDVSLVLNGSPQWTTGTTVDGLPIGLPMFDVHTVGAGGGSIAFLDAGGAIRVGPRSAGAIPGPACYARGGSEPTVTDANLLLGRIMTAKFLGGAMALDIQKSTDAITSLARQINKTPIATALGVVRIAEANMAAAIRAVTSRRGHDPRDFTLVSFGGAGGLHACGVAYSLDISRVLVSPYAGVLSALGMVVAPPMADASQTVLHLGDALDDERLPAEVGRLSGRTIDIIPFDQSAAVEVYADVRFRGQSYEVRCRVFRPSLQHIHEQFLSEYARLYGTPPQNRPIEIVTLRVRRFGRPVMPALPKLPTINEASAEVALIDATGELSRGKALTRSALLMSGRQSGPLLLIDAEATAYVPPHWRASATDDGCVILERV